MSNFPVASIIELVGDSKQSWEDAAQQAITEAGKTIQHIRGIEVKNMTANVNQQGITEYKVNLHLSFGVDGNLRNRKAAARG